LIIAAAVYYVVVAPANRMSAIAAQTPD